MQDNEINWVLSQYNNTPMNAAIRCCETIMSKFSRLANESVGQVRIDFSQKAKGYRDMLLDLRKRLAMEDCSPYAGGISVVDKISNRQNTDNVRPDFKKHMFENEQLAPWTTQTELDLFLALED